MARYYVPDGNRCLVVEGATEKEARMRAVLIARARAIASDREIELPCADDHHEAEFQKRMRRADEERAKREEPHG